MDFFTQALGAYSTWGLVLALAAVAAGAILQTAVGFGFALVAAPILLFIDPSLVPVPISLTALLLTGSNYLQNREQAHWHGLLWIGLGNLPGYALGALALLLLPLAQMALLFGFLTLAMVGLSISHLHFRPTRHWLLPMGALSAFSGLTTSMNGPPIALSYQHAPGPQVRGTLAVYFFLSNWVLIALFAIMGRLDAQAISAGLLLAPAVLVGLWVGRYFTRWLDAGRTRRAVLWISAISALAVMLRYGL